MLSEISLIHPKILYKDEHKRIIWKIGFTLDFGIKSLIHPLNVPQHYRCAGEHLSHANIKMRKLNAPTTQAPFSK